jgi:hypothetical protein
VMLIERVLDENVVLTERLLENVKSLVLFLWVLLDEDVLRVCLRGG